MEIIYKPWEWTSVITEGGGYNLVKADEKTRKKQLEEYKKKRKAELEQQIRELDTLHQHEK
jgi:hypothetical protein